MPALAVATASSSVSPAYASGQRIVGLDSLRFVLAIWVCLSHFGLHVHRSPTFLSGITNSLFNGAAAVTGFFVISGLCIHWPQTAENTGGLNTLAFYARRLTRIAVPLAAAVIAGAVINESVVDFYRAILWSLVAEMFYYAAYPAMLFLISSYGFELILAGAYVVSGALVVTHPRAMNFHQFGPYLTWLVGLPSWLLGCRLAVVIRRGKARLGGAIWSIRGCIWALSVMASILRFHAGIGYPVTLTLLGPALFFWIKEELLTAQRPNKALESLGALSYSVYLTHGIAIACLVYIAPWAQANPALPIRLAFIVAFALGFYVIVERPSHNLARLAGSFIQRGAPGRLPVPDDA